MWPCDICLEVFQTEGSLNQHRKSHKEATHKMCPRYICPFCHFSTTDQNFVQQHVLTHATDTTTEVEVTVDISPNEVETGNTVLVPMVEQASLEDRASINLELVQQHLTTDGIEEVTNAAENHQSVSVLNPQIQMEANKMKTILSDLIRPNAEANREPERKFACLECGKTYKVASHLKQHMKTHSENRPYVCDFCGKGFKLRTILNKHMLIHTQGKTFECPECKRMFQQKAALGTHIRRVHIKDKEFFCSLCKKGFYTKWHLDKHECPTLKPTHVCEQCQERFKDIKEFERHLHKHFGGKVFECEECGKLFLSKMTLRSHLRLHKSKNHLCQKCGKAFVRSFDLRRHAMTHTMERPHVCPFCNKGYTQKPHLKAHLKKHPEYIEPETEKPKKMINRSRERIHELVRKKIKKACKPKPKTKDPNRKPCKCRFCDAQFTNRGLLKAHIVEHGEKPHLCVYCGKTFRRQTELCKHVKTHTGEKPNKCSVCEKAFIKLYTLREHMRTHTGERPHQCPYCEKRFAQGSTLRTHIRTHTREKPYVCGLCSEAFSTNRALKKHGLTHTILVVTDYQEVTPDTAIAPEMVIAPQANVVTHEEGLTDETVIESEIATQTIIIPNTVITD